MTSIETKRQIFNQIKDFDKKLAIDLVLVYHFKIIKQMVNNSKATLNYCI